MQRLAEEPRLPNVQGFQFVNETPEAAEMHYLLKSILLRPAYLPDPDEDLYTRDLRYCKAFEAYCSAPSGEDDWPAQRLGPESPGPFQRGWTRFFTEQQEHALEASRKCLASDCCLWAHPSIWNTREVAETIREKSLEAEPGENAACDAWQEEYPYEHMLSAAEYC